MSLLDQTLYRKIKWSTFSTWIALIIIIIYATIGLYTLVNLTRENDVKLLFTWISLGVYFTVAVLTTVLICGIFLSQPWLLFVWAVLMMVLLLLDGMSTIASLQNTHGQHFIEKIEGKVLFIIMAVRLTTLLFGIFTTFFHFRRLIKYQTESQERARILKRYEHHSIPSSIESLREKAAPLPPDRFDSLRSLPQQRSNIVLSPPPFCQSIRDDGTLIPRVATINRNPTMLIQRGLRQDGKPENFRYNIPLNELFHQIQTNEADQHHQQQENF